MANLPVRRGTKTLLAFILIRIARNKTPSMNASTGRLREAFLETHEDWIDDLQQMNEAPADWLTGYNGFRPHRSLNMTTPLTRFYSSINDHLGCGHTKSGFFNRRGYNAVPDKFTADRREKTLNKFFIAKSRRLRETPYTDRIESQGAAAYSVYNHMLLPAVFSSPEEDYFHLKQHVQIWDVSCERQVQIVGEDAAVLTQLMTCRNLKAAKTGKCYYCPLIDENAGMVNDPLVMKPDDNKWWISIADSDVLLYAKGLAAGLGLRVLISEPDVIYWPSKERNLFALMEKIFGADINTLRYFAFAYFGFGGHQFLIARSGWSKQGGFEIYVDDREAGLRLYDELFVAGEALQVRPGCPNLIERIESGLLSYGNDMEIHDNPIHCGLERFADYDEETRFLGKEKLSDIMAKGVSRKLRGVLIDMDAIAVVREIPLFSAKSEKAGALRSAAYSPSLGRVVGIAMLNKTFWPTGTPITVHYEGKEFSGVVCDFPFKQCS